MNEVTILETNNFVTKVHQYVGDIQIIFDTFLTLLLLKTTISLNRL